MRGHIGFSVGNVYLTEVYNDEDVPELHFP